MLSNPEFWVALGFVIFVALVWKRGKSAVLGAVDKRIERIRGQIDEAARLKAEAEAMLRDAEQRRATAIKEAAELVASAQAAAQQMKTEHAASLEALVQRRQQAALEKIAQAEAAALAEVRRTAVDVAIAATRRLLAEEVRGNLADRLVDDAIRDLPNRLQ